MRYKIDLTGHEVDQIGRALSIGFPRTKPLWDKLKAQCVEQEKDEAERFKQILVDIPKTLAKAGKKLMGPK